MDGGLGELGMNMVGWRGERWGEMFVSRLLGEILNV